MLRSAVLGTDFGTRGKNTGWNASYFGVADYHERQKFQVNDLTLQFLETHADSLEEIKLFSPLNRSDIPTEVIRFPRLNAIVLAADDKCAGVFEAPNLRSFEIAHRSGPDTELGTHTHLHAAPFVTMSMPQVLSALQLHIQARPKGSKLPWESLNVVIYREELLHRFHPSMYLLSTLPIMLNALCPKVHSLTFIFEGPQHPIGIRNWSYLLRFPNESPSDDDNNNDLKSESPKSESSYFYSSDDTFSDPAEYYDDSDEWSSTDEGSEEAIDEGNGDLETSVGAQKESDPSTINLAPTSEVEPDMLRLLVFDGLILRNHQQTIGTLFPEVPRDFSEAYDQFLRILPWVIHTRKTAGPGLAFEHVTIAPGDRCQADLSLPKHLEGIVSLRGRS